jgi:hypothetical protein
MTFIGRHLLELCGGQDFVLTHAATLGLRNPKRSTACGASDSIPRPSRERPDPPLFADVRAPVLSRKNSPSLFAEIPL